MATRTALVQYTKNILETSKYKVYQHKNTRPNYTTIHNNTPLNWEIKSIEYQCPWLTSAYQAVSLTMAL